MFVQNNQPSLFSFEAELSEKQRKSLEDTKEKWFYKLIFCNINENIFKPLYSDKASRPNIAVNILASSLILKELNGLSIDELMGSIQFDLRYKVALGLSSINEVPFARASIFNFQNKIADYEQKTGVNLMETIFASLTAQQIKELSLKTNIQRADSTLISSNIKRYSRLKLLIEVLIRLERILTDEDRVMFHNSLQLYTTIGSEKYIYKLKSADLPHELQKLGNIYHAIFTEASNKVMYKTKIEYINFERVYNDHFVVIEKEISPKPSAELNSNMLQSPDDVDATYRKKNDKESFGFTINAVETANPANPIQLIDDIVVNPNNVDDSIILNNRIDIITQKTPDLEELHTDGGYGSEDNDKSLEKLGITQITTAVRGRESEIDKIINLVDTENNIYSVSCPYQTAMSTPTKQRNKVRFDTNICKNCPLSTKCRIFKENGRYYFKHEDFLQNTRNRNILNIPPERQKIRPNVEASMKEFKTRTNAGKIKVRGIFKTSLFAFNVGIAINFGRIFRYLCKMSFSPFYFMGYNRLCKEYSKIITKLNLYIAILLLLCLHIIYPLKYRFYNKLKSI